MLRGGRLGVDRDDGANANAARRGGRQLEISDGRIRVAVCDDHGPFRRLVAWMLSLAEDIEVVGEDSTHEEAVAIASEGSPEVVLLDLEMPGGYMGAYESVGRMLTLPAPSRVVVFTKHDEPGMVGHFLTLGVAGYVAKSAEMYELVEAVRDAARDAGPDGLRAGSAGYARVDPSENDGPRVGGFRIPRCMAPRISGTDVEAK